MAFGFPAHHEEEIETPRDISRGWIAHVCGLLGWGFRGEHADPKAGVCWRMAESLSWAAWGTNISAWPLGARRLRVRSECALVTQCIDWGRNRRNVQALREILIAEMEKETDAQAALSPDGKPQP